jgi:hypothetical protein
MDLMANFNREAICKIYSMTIHDVDEDESRVRDNFIKAVHLINEDAGSFRSPGELLATRIQQGEGNLGIKNFVENILNAIVCPEDAKRTLSPLLNDMLEICSMRY